MPTASHSAAESGRVTMMLLVAGSVRPRKKGCRPSGVYPLVAITTRRARTAPPGVTRRCHPPARRRSVAGAARLERGRADGEPRAARSRRLAEAPDVAQGVQAERVAQMERPVGRGAAEVAVRERRPIEERGAVVAERVLVERGSPSQVGR